ncbi:TonB family protein [Methylobacterium sp. P5_C11]
MPFSMSLRVLTAGAVVLGLTLAPTSLAAAREHTGPEVRGWLSDLVTRIDAAGRAERGREPVRRAGTVVVRLEIAADGAVQRAEIERSSGSEGLDRRALRAVRDIGPTAAPPAPLLSEAGTVDLSIPVQLGR